MSSQTGVLGQLNAQCGVTDQIRGAETGSLCNGDGKEEGAQGYIVNEIRNEVTRVRNQ